MTHGDDKIVALAILSVCCQKPELLSYFKWGKFVIILQLNQVVGTIVLVKLIEGFL